MFAKIKEKSGLTLIELLITMALLAILLGVSIPLINQTWLPGYRLKSSVRDIASTVRYARMKAISMNKEYRIVFDVANDTYQKSCGNKSDGSDSWITEGGWTSTRDDIDMYDVTSFSSDTLVFNPDGSAEGVNGAVYLSNSKNERYRVRVVTATGNIDIQSESEW